jgi:hypothetical protein
MSLTARKVYDLLETQPGAEFAPGSWWQGVNAATYFIDHIQGRNIDNRLTMKSCRKDGTIIRTDKPVRAAPIQVNDVE